MSLPTLTVVLQIAEVASASHAPNPLASLDWIAIGLQISAAISPALLAILGWAAAAVARFVVEKTKNEKVRDLLLRLDTLAFKVVLELEQTMVDAIREANADGKITEEEKATIKAKALENLKSYLGAKGVLELKTIIGLDDGVVTNLLSTAVESALFSVKAKLDAPHA